MPRPSRARGDACPPGRHRLAQRRGQRGPLPEWRIRRRREMRRPAGRHTPNRVARGPSARAGNGARDRCRRGRRGAPGRC
ncbi:hypothetical protein N864_13180 [Intrasporangium chromatireducens Q5-1]|uniref:Uncharacterized protein n=1 Tax=Intrasporangium chromatireducens Q5-1 TaxID=584657 RepID=W9GDU0_9MICO|nr:hypothetical protein N864_13180 [Intrasporangium chromatireducens Q5-1]